MKEFIEWQKAAPRRHVDIEINQHGVKIWVFDTALMAGQFVHSVDEIDLEAVSAQRDREEYERLRAKFAEVTA